MSSARRAFLVAMLACAAAACAGSRLTEAELSDPGIRARLEAQLQAQRDLDLRYVTIDVHHGIVTISGLVPTWEQKRKIDRITRSLEGVEQSLVNLLIQD